MPSAPGQTEDLELLRRFEPVLCFSGATHEERFLPLAIEAFLGECRLFSGRPGRIGKGRNLTTVWDAAASLDASLGKGAARARTLTQTRLSDTKLGPHAFLVATDPKAAREAARRARPEPIESLGPALGVLPIAGLLLGGALFGATRERPILFWALTILGVVLLLGAGLIALRSRVGTKKATSLWSDFLALAFLVVAFVAWRDGSTGTATVFGLLGSLAFLAQLFQRLRAAFSQVVAEAWTAVASVALVSGLTLYLWNSRWALLIPAWLLGTILILYGPALAAGVMELLSPLRLRASTWAADRERRHRETPQGATYPYYGRVWREQSTAGGASERLCLQYFYFYAFNDWRHQQGFNYHEGDWEAALVFLEPAPGADGEAARGWAPSMVALSRHHRGERRSWSSTTRITSPRGEHPVLWVAAGSHALYFEPGTFNLPDLVPGGLRRRLLAAWQTFRDNSLRSSEEGRETAQRALGRPAETRPSRDDGTSDRANGSGLVIGPVQPNGPTATQARADWTPVLLDETEDRTGWIEFQGRWGQRSLLRDESGPPGPKWSRRGTVDPLWSDPHAWAETLEPPKPSSR